MIVSRMRIGVLTTSYPRDDEDFAGSFVAASASYFADRGDQVEVLAPYPAKRASGDALVVRPLRYALVPRLFYRAGAPDNLLGGASLGQRCMVWAQIPAYGLRTSLEILYRRSNWDAVISHWLLPSGLLAAELTTWPHLAIAHSSDVHLLGRLPWGKALLARLARPASRLVLTSEALRPILLGVAAAGASRHFVEDAAVIRMGYDRPTCSAENPRVAHGLEAELLILFVGRLVAVKGVDRLIRAVAAAGREVRVVIIGDGPMRSALEELAQQLDRPALFLGEVTGPAKQAWFDAADLFVAPSIVLDDGRQDSAPMVLLEALAAGLPTITTRVGGAAELIEDGEDGMLVERDDQAALVFALQTLIDDPELRKTLGERAEKKSQRYRWSAIGSQLRRALQQI